MDGQTFRARSWLEWLTWLLLAASCCYLVLSLLAYGMGEPLSGHAFIHPMRMQPPFADLRYVAANAECGVDLNDYYAGRVVGCDPSGRTYPFDYPPMSIWLGRFLHVQGSHVPLIAISTGVALILCIVLGLKACLGASWQWRLLSSGVLMGYPLQQPWKGAILISFFSSSPCYWPTCFRCVSRRTWLGWLPLGLLA
jgi:hypothetical protein